MCLMDSDFADKISQECLTCYQNLPKKGKPIPNREWALLSSVVMTLNGKFTVVAMATGTKCLGRSGMSLRGDVVNDSHAEVLARRCFLRYMYDQIYNFKCTGSSEIIISCNERNQFVINPEVKFHFYSSHIPCGDASIIPKFSGQNKRKLEIVSHIEKRARIDVLEGSTKTEKIINEDLRKQCQSPRETFSNNMAHCKGISADEDLRKVTTVITDKDRLDPNNCHTFFSTQSAVSDDDIRILHTRVVHFKQDSFNSEEDLLGSIRNRNKPTRNLINNQDNRIVNEYKNELYKKKMEDKNFGTVKVSDCKDSEDFSFHNRVVDENVSSVVCDERVKDCVGEVLDIYRTGAKCVEAEDCKLPGALYHRLAAVRTKPGRGDPTLSVSCSDKLARWIACGLQGALLSLLLSRPVVLDSVVIGSGGPYSKDVLERALITRTGTPNRPCLLQSTIMFPHSRYTASPTAKPCPSAVLWARVGHKTLEVCVEGKRQGATKKCRDNGRLAICKLELLRAFLSVSGDRYREMRYREIKASAEHYNSVWAQARSSLGVWTTKPQHLQDFTLTKITHDYIVRRTPPAELTLWAAGTASRAVYAAFHRRVVNSVFNKEFGLPNIMPYKQDRSFKELHEEVPEKHVGLLSYLKFVNSS